MLSRLNFVHVIIFIFLSASVLQHPLCAQAPQPGPGPAPPVCAPPDCPVSPTPGNYLYPQPVGGVSIDAEGLLENASTEALGNLAKIRKEFLQPIPEDLKKPAGLRKISLRRIDAVLQECIAQRKRIPDDLFYLGGLQQIQYIFVYPEQNDIVLVGPGEGWKVDSRGNVVGLSTGRPVMLLDDLLVALRSAQQAAEGGIRCSIEPTPEGVARLQSYAQTVTRMTDPQQLKSNYEALLGPQQITVAGVPATSHFARVLVAADYRMKRIGMNFEAAPPGVKLPSYLQMAPRSGRGMMTPRFWLEPNYKAILRDAGGMAWELRGAGVKALTEEAYMSASGNQGHSTRSSSAAQRWADQMTEQYPTLSVADPIFGQLQNCMELAVVAALLVKERLPERAAQSLTVLTRSEVVKPMQLPPPKQVATQVSILKKGNGWIVSASGGVMIPSWNIASNVQVSDQIAAIRRQMTPTREGRWWWN
jgi:hypothetical protein